MQRVLLHLGRALGFVNGAGLMPLRWFTPLLDHPAIFDGYDATCDWRMHRRKRIGRR